MTPCQLDQHPERLSDLKTVEVLLDSSHYGVWLARCKQCGALYVGCYIEVWDDSWSFYAPIGDDEAAEIRSDHDRARDMIAGRPHIVWPPAWKERDPYWNEGPEDALTMGPRAW